MKRWSQLSILIVFALAVAALLVYLPPKRESYTPDPDEIGFDRMVGQRVKISLHPNPIFITSGAPLPPGTRTYETDREVYYAVLASMNNKTAAIRPLDGLPKHFGGGLYYAHSAGFPRDRIERIKPLTEEFASSHVNAINQTQAEADDLGFDSVLEGAP